MFMQNVTPMYYNLHGITECQIQSCAINENSHLYKKTIQYNKCSYKQKPNVF